MPALEESIGEFKTFTIVGEFNSDGSNKTEFLYEEYTPLLESEGKFFKGTTKDEVWNNGFILKKSNGKKVTT